MPPRGDRAGPRACGPEVALASLPPSSAWLAAAPTVLDTPCSSTRAPPGPWHVQLSLIPPLVSVWAQGSLFLGPLPPVAFLHGPVKAGLAAGRGSELPSRPPAHGSRSRGAWWVNSPSPPRGRGWRLSCSSPPGPGQGPRLPAGARTQPSPRLRVSRVLSRPRHCEAAVAGHQASPDLRGGARCPGPQPLSGLRSGAQPGSRCTRGLKAGVRHSACGPSPPLRAPGRGGRLRGVHGGTEASGQNREIDQGLPTFFFRRVQTLLGTTSCHRLPCPQNRPGALGRVEGWPHWGAPACLSVAGLVTASSGSAWPPFGQLIRPRPSDSRRVAHSGVAPFAPWGRAGTGGGGGLLSSLGTRDLCGQLQRPLPGSGSGAPLGPSWAPRGPTAGGLGGWFPGLPPGALRLLQAPPAPHGFPGPLST